MTTRREGDESSSAGGGRRVSRCIRTRRGKAGILILLVLVLVAWFAPILASTKPVACKYQGRWGYPGLVDVVRNVPLLDRLVSPVKPFHLPSYDSQVMQKECVAWVPALIRYSPLEYSAETLEPPSGPHWLGTDELGRDVAARLIHATGIALKVGLGTMLLAALVGILIGGWAGYAGGWMDAVLSRLIEIVICFPAFFLVLSILIWVEEPSVWHIVWVLGLTMWTSVARYIRAEMLRLRDSEMALAARAIGLPGWRIVLRHLVPNAVAPALSVLPFVVANAILIEAGLSWLGFGIPEPTPSWGGMLRGAYDQYLVASWLVWPPCVMIFLAVLSNHLIGDSLRETMDVRGRGAYGGRAGESEAGSVLAEERGVGSALLAIRDLRVDYSSGEGEFAAVRGISLDVHRGATLVLVGPSGCGKSSIALAVMGLLPAGALAGGRICLGTEDLLALDSESLRRVRMKRFAIVFQDPMNGLNPVMRVGKQVAESVQLQTGCGRREAWRKAVELLGMVELPEPKRIGRCWPHQLSGGMRQRVMIAMAMAGRPELLIADEPTTALDVTIQDQIITLLKKLQAERGMSILWITHDFRVVQRVADEVCVVHEGQVVEASSVKRILQSPVHEVTRRLIEDAGLSVESREGQAVCEGDGEGTILECRHCCVRFKSRHRMVEAVDDVSLSLHRGETVGLVGESGCGKSTLLKAMAGLIPLHSGEVLFDGRSLAGLSGSEFKGVRQRMQILFQDAGGSLNPRMRVGSLIAEAARCHLCLGWKDIRRRVGDVLELVGLSSADAFKYPHEFSGGQKQRGALARAMILQPELLLCDEPVTGLDVSAKKDILELLRFLQDREGLTLLLATHDLSLVQRFCDRVVIMDVGRVVESGSVESVMKSPKHVRTRAFIAAVSGRPVSTA